MTQMPPDELLYEWFREAQTSETKKFTVNLYDDCGYATNAYDVILRVVEWCNSHKEFTVTEPTKPVPQEQSIARMNRETTITKENLYILWTALEYTRATIGSGYDFPSMEGKMDYQLIHKGRAHQSRAFLEQAINIINQMREELN